jgi:hypothetical protein
MYSKKKTAIKGTEGVLAPSLAYILVKYVSLWIGLTLSEPEILAIAAFFSGLYFAIKNYLKQK